MKVPALVVPALVVLCAALGVGGARFLVMPSVVKEFAPAAPAAGFSTTVMVVSGLKCVDTAERAAAQLEDLPGVVRFTAFASRNRAEVLFDPSRTSAEAIREAIEGPVHDKETGEFLFGVYRVVEADGVKYPDPRP